MDAVIFGTQLSQLRKKNGVTQRELAQKLHVHIMTIKSCAGGSCYPGAKNLCMLADSFHISTDYSLGRDEAEVNTPPLDGHLNRSLYKGGASQEVNHDTGGNSMTNYKEILRLHSLGINNTRIAESCGCARSTVIAALQRAREQELSWNKIKNCSTEEVAQKLYPFTALGQQYKMPDYEYVNR